MTEAVEQLKSQASSLSAPERAELAYFLLSSLEPEDLRALTLEASMITGVPLAGTNVVFAGGPGWKK